MLKTTTALATILMLSTAPVMVSADDMSTSTNANAAVTVKTLPKSGASVSLDGTVESVSNNKNFTLRDATGATIDVESDQEIALNKGDRVSVDGKVDSTLLGFSKEIDASSIRITERANADMASEDTSRSTGNFLTDAQKATTGAIAGAGSAIGSAADSTVNATKNAASSVSDTASNAANSVSERASNMMDSSKEWHGGEYGSIDKLPEKGQVMIEAKVASVSDDMKRFVIEDETGETIDVHSSVAVNLREGDTVKVKGEMRDEIAGMGEEITAYEVSVNRQ